MKKQKEKENNRAYMGYFVSTLLIIMISYFVIGIQREVSQKKPNTVKDEI